MTELSWQQKRMYMKNEGVRCPVCHSQLIKLGEFEKECMALYQKESCDACGSEWMVEYTLALNAVASNELDELPFSLEDLKNDYKRGKV